MAGFELSDINYECQKLYEKLNFNIAAWNVQLISSPNRNSEMTDFK